MKIRYDDAIDALYLRFSEEKISGSEEVKPGIVFDYDEQGRLVALEILDVKTVVAPGQLLPVAAE